MLEDRVERLKQVINESRMSLIGEQEVWSGESLEKLHQPGGSLDADILEVWGDVCDADRKSGE